MKQRFPVHPGRMVRSKAGRDAGRFMLVLAVEDETFALVADGRLRTVAKPKRKKLLHLLAKPECAEDLRQRIESGQPILDAQVRAALKQAGYDQPDSPSKEG